MQGCFREEWERRPWHIIGYVLVAVLCVAGFVMSVVNATSAVHTAGVVMVFLGIVLLLLIGIARCAEARRSGAEVVVI